MELLADRFAALSNGVVIDLADGEPALLAVASCGGASDQRRWAMRCDVLYGLRHRFIARLIDFGTIAEAERFEAWRCGAPWAGAPAEAARAVEAASAFLSSCGLTAGVLAADAVRCTRGGAAILPTADTGHAGAAERVAAGSLGSDAYGIAIHARRATAAIAELFGSDAGSRPRAVALWGLPRAGKSTVAMDLARAARLNGFVPVAANLLEFEPIARLVSGRSLLIIDDETGRGWGAWVDATMNTPRPHVLLLIGGEEVPGVDGIALEPLAPRTLMDLVRPTPSTRPIEQRAARAAEHAQGLPGRFIDLLWGHRSVPRRAWPSRSVAAEEPATYAIEEPADANGPAISAPEAQAWPAPGELAALRRRMTAATRLLDEGRRAPGERALRQAVGGLGRRGDWTHAGAGACALAAALLKRGSPQEAHTVLDEAREYCRRGRDGATLVSIAVLQGVAWIDLARLDEAEAVLASAATASRSRGDEAQAASAALAMARCLFWRGRFVDADRVLGGVASDGGDGRMAVRSLALRSRVAVGLGDLGRAVATALAAVERANVLDDSTLAAQAAGAAAFAHLAVGDLDAVERDGSAWLAAAHRARDPLRALRARLVLAEVARRKRRRAAATLVRRLSAVAGLPPIVRARVALMKDLVDNGRPSDEIVKRHVAASGLDALALFAPLDRTAPSDVRLHAPSVATLVEILHVCQSAADEDAVLMEVSRRVRRDVEAAAVGFAGHDSGATVWFGSDGGRLDAALVERVLAAGIAIAPHRREDRVEAAVPVKYGGALIGALVARWPLGAATERRAGAIPVMTMAAAAAAPAVAASTFARRAAPPSPATSGLLGSSRAMEDVRRAIERAARAPFAVLIEGESGSGKELVARALHRLGPRRARAFCTVNCAALPDDLIEAELFGHARGAFTSAVADRPGVFEEAHGGTLFLDEIGELSARAQAKVLRVLQEGELRRVGENMARRVDVRVVAATNRDLRADVTAARFRLDLLYRLDVVRIVVPPLRDRREDIAVLAEHIWREATARLGSRAALAAATIAALARHEWPGNVRELQNVLAALAVRTPKRGVVPPDALPPVFGATAPSATWRLDEARRTFEERFVRAALVRAGGYRVQAASELGVTRQGLVKLMNRLGITD